MQLISDAALEGVLVPSLLRCGVGCCMKHWHIAILVLVAATAVDQWARQTMPVLAVTSPLGIPDFGETSWVMVSQASTVPEGSSSTMRLG